MSFKMIVLPGDGIGPEVTVEAVRVMEWFREHRGLDVTLRHERYGAAAYHAQGTVISDEAMADLLAADGFFLAPRAGQSLMKFLLRRGVTAACCAFAGIWKCSLICAR